MESAEFPIDAGDGGFVDIDTLLARGDAALIPRYPWERTGLGAESSWPQSLRTAVRILITSRFPMWLGWGPDLAFLYNDAYRRMTIGRKHPWAFARPASVVWSEIWADIGPRVEAVMQSGRATWDEALLLFLERSGFPEETYHTFSYSPLNDDDGRIAGMLCVVSEETDRVIGERRLSTLRELAAGLATVTRQDDVLAAATRALGGNMHDLPFTLTFVAEPGEMTLRLAASTGIDATHPAAPAELHSSDGVWPAHTEGGAHVLVDDLATRFTDLPTGSWSRPPTRALVVPIAQSGQDHPYGYFVAALNPFRAVDDSYVGFVRLIAGQLAASLANARAYEAERQRAEQLADLDRAKTQFFSNVSHEFRTPLTLLLGPVEDALTDPTEPPRTRERLEVIHRNGLRLLRLVNSLLDFSRMEAGRLRAEYRPTAMGPYTAELASSFRSAAERGGLQLKIDCADPLPDAAPVYVDQDMWEKVVLNLVANAFKHTFEGEIAVTLREDADGAELTVRDTGIGIPEDQLPHIFERFHRVPNARSRTHEGTGIGLSLVQEVVRLHGGRIDVRSVLDEGTTFTVHLPRGAAHLPAEHVATDAGPAPVRHSVPVAAFVEEALRWLPDAPTPAPDADEVPSPAATPSRTAGSKVLVADDNADMRDYVSRLLRERGYDVTAVSDGSAALRAVRSSAPDLLLTDVMMPGLDGFGLLAELRREPATRDLPVVLLSAREGEEARTQGLQSGADDYVVKPFSGRELLARVESRIELHRARREAAEERERLMRRISEERERLQALFTHAPAAIAVLSGPDHVFAAANDLYRRFVGNRPIIGRPVREALPEVKEQGLIELLDRVYRTGEAYVGKELNVKVDSTGDGMTREHYFTFVYQPIVENGATSGIFAFIMEVSDQVRARREAETARELAEGANRAKSAFLAAMSHELRTPLNAIGGYAQLLEMGVHGPVSTDQRFALQRLLRSQQHLLGLINDVLNFAKLEAGRVEYDIQNFALVDMIASVGPMVEPQLREKGLSYDTTADESLMARADAEKVQQILLNLLSNAIKFTPPGGAVTVRAWQKGETIALDVNDSGIGIPAERQQSIFDPFVQAHRIVSGSVAGTGLGLSISRDLARAMGGDITVRSAPSEGSTFTVTLPAAPAR